MRRARTCISRVFGPDSAYRAFVGDARHALVRDTTDAMLLANVDHALDRPRAYSRKPGVRDRVVRTSARLLDNLTGGRRFEACLAHLQRR